MREYTHGSRWALWRWTEIAWKGEPYMRRLHLVKTPWFAVMLHWILTEDPHPDPHDHPVSFLSICLRGGYAEDWRPAESPPWPAPTWHFNVRRTVRHRKATDIHHITAAKSGTLTLVFAGPVVRRWGFHTRDGWVDWKEYRDEHAR